jgi:hypothetical protein
MLCRYLLSILIGLLLCRVSLAAAEQEEGWRECLLISDIHFDPFADPSLFESLTKRAGFRVGSASRIIVRARSKSARKR